MEHFLVIKNPSWYDGQTSWLLTSSAEDLNSGRDGTGLGLETSGLQVRRCNRSFTLPPIYFNVFFNAEVM